MSSRIPFLIQVLLRNDPRDMVDNEVQSKCLLLYFLDKGIIDLFKMFCLLFLFVYC